MSYRILTKNGIENTNIDGARDNNFNSGRRSGIVKGALNQGNFFVSSSNTIVLDTCELRLCGHRVVIDEAKSISFHNQPSVSIRYSLVAQIIVDNDGGVSFDLHAQTSSTALVQDNLDTSGSGTYELEIGRFTQLTDGTLTDVVRTADLITGGGNNDSEYIRIGTVTTNKISPELDADVDIENTINPDDNKPQTNFTFNLPTSVGTVVSVNGEEKTSINTDITPIASSENLITSGGVHDYPAVTFAESERQKSKNLLIYPYTGKAASPDITITENGDGSFTINGQKTVTDTNSVYFLYTFNNWTDKISSFKLSAGTYTGKLFASVNADIQLVLTDGSMYQNININTNTTFTITNDTYFEVYLQVPKHNTSVFNNLVVYPMIVKGTDLGDYQPYNGAIVHEKQIEITIGDATLNTDVVSSGEVSWVKLGKLVVVSFSDIKFKGSVAHQNLYFSGLPKKAIKAQTFLLYKNDANGGSSLRCMMQTGSTQIINWYDDVTLDTEAQYYGQLTYITDEN